MAKKQQPAKSKRQIIREQRLKRQRQQRLIAILAVSVVAIVIAALLIVPSLTPVGEIAQITPVDRPSIDGTALGNPDAPVLIEVWEDFQCPACRTFSEDVEPLIIENYVSTGKARYVFRHYPFLDDRVVSKESDQAANASMCASEQGRFWDYHDILFANWNSENAGAFSDKRLVAYAENLNLDMASFNSCFKENTYKEQIDKDLADGTSAGVQGTPSLFVNGQHITPGFIPSYAEVSQAVEAALSSSGN
ncbi:MAG TPA: DsbA family protein [Anaerolineales bacterium]|nr:DsbA family protein [Anaerolineales bacterium]